MPYTPPAKKSPAASTSATPSPNPSNSQAIQQQSNGLNHEPRPRPVLPHSSSSYLSRHRRSPSLVSLSVETEQKTSSSLDVAADSGTSSSQTSSDDEDQARQRREREIPQLAELQAAIMIIEQHRESSPEKITQERLKARAVLGLSLPRINPDANGNSLNARSTSALPLSAAARKISHSRSSTDMSALLDIPRSCSSTPNRSASDSDQEDAEVEQRMHRKAPRKQSGELVKPALRAPKTCMRRRPSSMPGTPSETRGVHFDQRSLEQVTFFKTGDRPMAVSAGASPTEQYAESMEYPFPERSHTPTYTWEIRLTNFPRESPLRNAMPIRVEKVYLSGDNKNLIGAIAVANLAFHKLVVARFTLDYWKTTSEVVADYNNDVRRKQINDGCDRFNFSIKLEDQANLENKTLFFCVRYSVNGQEYWDNNNSFNYQVDFTKTVKPQQDKSQAAQHQGLPRSKPPHSSSSRPRSFPSGIDEFSSLASTFKLSSLPPPPGQIVGDSPIRFKKQNLTSSKNPDDFGGRLNSGPSQAFGHRYDFGSALNMAMQNINGGSPESRTVKSAPAKQISFAQQPLVGTGSITPASAAKRESHLGNPKTNGVESMSTPDTMPSSLTSEKPSLQSQSYKELVERFCFYGSNKSGNASGFAGSPKSEGLVQMDGPSDEPAIDTKPVEIPISQSKNEPSTVLPWQFPESKPSSSIFSSPRASRSTSPAASSKPSSRAASPVPFTFPYNPPMQNSFFIEQHAPTAITS